MSRLASLIRVEQARSELFGLQLSASRTLAWCHSRLRYRASAPLLAGIDAAAAQDPFWKVLVIAIPPTTVSAYVGWTTTEWATRQTMAGKPKLWKRMLKGLLFGAIDGATILMISYIPFFIAGYY
jgi:hypothetical protein